MSNSNLFMKSGFPRAPLQNGVGRYVCQLQRLTLKFCKSTGGSKGMRDFIANRLLDFAKENPGVVLYVKPRRNRGAVLVGEYLNGDRHHLSVKNCTEIEVTKWIGLLRTQNGNSSAVRMRKFWHTDCPSIQGPWTPFTQRNPELNVTAFPNPIVAKPLDVQKSATDILIELYAKQTLEEHSNPTNIVVDQAEGTETEKKN